MISKTRYLVLLEKGIERETWLPFVRKLCADDGGSLLVEDTADLQHLREERIRGVCLSDLIPIGGHVDGALFSDACSLAEEWIDVPPLSHFAKQLQYEEIPFWKMGRLTEVYGLFQILRGLEAVKRTLESEEIEQVIVLQNRGLLSKVVHLAVSMAGFKHDVRSVSMEQKRNFVGRMYDFLGIGRLIELSGFTGFASQTVIDVRNGWRFRRRCLKLRQTTDSASRTYLFLLNERGAYAPTLDAVLQGLSQDDNLLILNTSPILSEASLQAYHRSLMYCSQLIPLSAWRRIIRKTLELRWVWDEIANVERNDEMFMWRGISLWVPFQDLLRGYLLKAFPRQVVWVEALKHLFEAYGPNAIVTVPDRHYPARLAIALGKRYQTPSLMVQSALISDHPRYGPVYADKAAVIDEGSRKIYMTRGSVSPNRLILTGSPRWDRFAKKVSAGEDEAAQQSVREQLGLHESDKVVVIATQPMPRRFTAAIIEAVSTAVSPLPEVRVVIKVHPAENVESYETLITSVIPADRVPIIVGRTNLHALLAISDLLVTHSSNVALEAAALDRSVLIVNLTGEPDPLPFVEEGIALGAYTEREAIEWSKRLLSDVTVKESLQRTRQAYMRQNPQLFDGRATERIVSLLRGMACNDALGGAQNE